ncbi:hypothetical protein BKA70DRAFT_1225109 [Coprinopsis sp. MPI-PUGE-AT-0042]|nr:hypothetical protein BKA70DRAFT_1225109 [Coprinopsis sp. MPI-PUGE-AT-0042]
MPPRVLKSMTCGEEGCRKENLPRMICKESPNVNNIGMAYYVCRGTVNVPHPSWFCWEADLNLEVIVPVDQGDLVTSGNSRDPPPPPPPHPTQPVSQAARPSATQASSTLPLSYQSDSQQPFDPVPHFYAALSRSCLCHGQEPEGDPAAAGSRQGLKGRREARRFEGFGEGVERATKPVTQALQVATYPIVKIDAALLESVGLVGAANFHYWDWDNQEWIKGLPDLWLKLSPPGDRDPLQSPMERPYIGL